MLRAVAADFAQLQDIKVLTIRDRQLESFEISRVPEVPADPATFTEVAARVLEDSDAAFVIAPESDQILDAHCQLVNKSDAIWLGCSQPSIELCSDKLRLAEILNRSGIPTVATSLPTKPSAWPVILKPRYGAGCEDTYVVTSEAEQARTIAQKPNTEFVQQPYLGPVSVSVAAIVSAADLIILPAVQQEIRNDSRQLRYAGGCLQVSHDHPVPRQLVADTLRATGISGGWVGIDFLCPNDGEPLVVDINPRLTTSYAAYRQATETNLAGLILGRDTAPPVWSGETFEFDKSGRVSPRPSPSRDPDRLRRL